MATFFILIFIGIIFAFNVPSVIFLVLIPYLIARMFVTLHAVGRVRHSIIVVNNSNVALRKLAKDVIAEFGIADSGLPVCVKDYLHGGEASSDVEGGQGG